MDNRILIGIAAGIAAGLFVYVLLNYYSDKNLISVAVALFVYLLNDWFSLQEHYNQTKTSQLN